VHFAHEKMNRPITFSLYRRPGRAQGESIMITSKRGSRCRKLAMNPKPGAISRAFGRPFIGVAGMGPCVPQQEPRVNGDRGRPTNERKPNSRERQLSGEPAIPGDSDGVVDSGRTTMANYRIGRVALHLMCILCGSDFRMHMAGVVRELQRT